MLLRLLVSRFQDKEDTCFYKKNNTRLDISCLDISVNTKLYSILLAVLFVCVRVLSVHATLFQESQCAVSQC